MWLVWIIYGIGGLALLIGPVGALILIGLALVMLGGLATWAYLT